SDLLHFDRASLVGEARVAGDDEQCLETGQRSGDFFHHAVGEEFLLRIAAQVLERQYGYGRLVWERKGRTQLIDRRTMRSRVYRVRTDRLGDVLEMLLATILEAKVQLPFDFAVNLFGDHDAARIGDPLQPDSNGDPVAVEIAVLPNDNVTKVEPDA